MNINEYKQKIFDHIKNNKKSKIEIEYSDDAGYIITYFRDGRGFGEEIQYELVPDLIEEIRKIDGFKVKEQDRFGDLFYIITPSK